MKALANHITPVVNGIGGVRMADDPRLGWVDMGGYGDWGEWHLSNQTGTPITHAHMDTIMKSVVTAFTKVWTVAMTERAQWLNDAVAMSPKVGLRVDCLGPSSLRKAFKFPAPTAGADSLEDRPVH